MLRDLGNIEKLESFLEEVDSLGVILDKRTYSAIQQMYLLAGNVDRAKQITELVSKHLLQQDVEHISKTTAREEAKMKMKRNAARRQKMAKLGMEQFLEDQKTLGLAQGNEGGPCTKFLGTHLKCSWGTRSCTRRSRAASDSMNAAAEWLRRTGLIPFCATVVRDQFHILGSKRLVGDFDENVEDEQHAERPELHAGAVQK